MRAATGVPWRSLVAITALVACAHWIALRGMPPPLGWPRAATPVSMRMRQLPPQAQRTAAQQPMPATAVPPRVERIERVQRIEREHRAQGPVPARPTPAPTAQGAPRDTGAPLSHATPPASAIWRYAVSAGWHGQRVPGEAALAWQHDGASYDATLVVSAPPLAQRMQHSAGEVAAEGLQPRRFSDRLRSEEATHFDRAQGRIAFSSNRPDAPLLPGAQDRLSLLLQLGALAAADPARLAPGASLLLQVAGTRGADQWLFTVEGTEVLALPAGSVRALKLTRVPQGEYDLRMEVWLGPGQDYAPVRLRLTPPNGDWLDLQWSGTDKR